MTLKPWHVHVSFTTTEPLPEDLPFDVMDELSSAGAAMSVSRDLTGGRVAMTLDSPSAVDACAEAAAALAESLRRHNMRHDVTAISAQAEPEFLAELDAPTFPEVLGYAEIAELAGVSRQRARQFASIPGFPKPVITTAQGPLMAKDAVVGWLSRRNVRRPARAS